MYKNKNKIKKLLIIVFSLIILFIVYYFFEENEYYETSIKTRCLENDGFTVLYDIEYPIKPYKLKKKSVGTSPHWIFIHRLYL